MSDRDLLDAFLAFLDVILGSGKTPGELASALGRRGMPGSESATPLSNATTALLGNVQGEAVDPTESGVRHNLTRYLGRAGTTLVLQKTGDVFSVASL